MNLSNLFKAAHKLAKSIIKAGDNYRVTFGACIKAIKEGFVASVAKIHATLNAWSKNGEQRVYINMKDGFDAGFMLIVGDIIDFSKVEDKYRDRVKSAVNAKLAKLQKDDEDYVQSDVAKYSLAFSF